MPVILLDLSEGDARLLNVALNQIGGEWDADLLARLLIDLRATADRDLTLSGFAEADLQDLLTRFDQRERRARPERFDLDEALAEYDREAGGIAPGAGWQLGAHRLFRGDATDAAFVARCLGDGPADLVFTDPPYNVSYGAHGGKAADAPARRLVNDALPAEAWERFCRAWAASLTANAAGALWILGRKVRHRCSQDLNTRTEQSYRAVKQRSDPMRGFGRFASAARFCSAFDELRHYFRARQRRGQSVPLAEQRRLFVTRWRSLMAELQAA